MPLFDDDLAALRERLEQLIEQTKNCMNTAAKNLKKRDVKPMRQKGDDFISVLQSIITVIDDRQWLVGKFGDEGIYQDVAGLCRIATTSEIAEKKNKKRTIPALCRPEMVPLHYILQKKLTSVCQ